jgi:ribosomal protein L11 methylase PrmA
VTAVPHPASFRDPGGRVYECEGRVFRTVMPSAAADFEFVRGTGLLDDLAAEGVVVPTTIMSARLPTGAAAGARYVLEHPRLPFISYPYEWSFSALKAAALLHLDVHLRALERGVTLSDASAYNVQFRGAQPVFIDALSFRRYREGEFWIGQRQFSEQFLNPLLLRALLGVPHNTWYRGSPEGIETPLLNRLLGLRHKLSWTVLTQVMLPAMLQSSAVGDGASASDISLDAHRLPAGRFRGMLERLRARIDRLAPADAGTTTWAEYARRHHYAPDEVQRKQAFVERFVRTMKPGTVWDLGCNTGDYAKLALDAGAGLVVGFDSDQRALEAAFARARAERLAFLPLFLDLANPSPTQGWAQRERSGLLERRNADAVLALAFVHHLAIARNVPLADLVDWLVALAPAGVVEFVPKADPMVQRLLRFRDDIFGDYSDEAFRARLQEQAEIVSTDTVSASGRKLYWYTRRKP